MWQVLAAIPYGETTSYGAIAESLGDRNLARHGRPRRRPQPAARSWCRATASSASDGKLTGYAGGLERKHFLLDLEGLAPVSAGRLF